MSGSPKAGNASEMSWWDNFLHMITPPEDISTTGHLSEYLFNYTTVLNVIYFFIVCVGLFGFTYYYYFSRHPKADYTHGNKKIHLLVTAGIGLLVFLSIDMNITRLSNNDLINVFWNWPKDSEKPLKVQVLAQQWMWHFRYAGKDGAFNTKDDVIMPNKLVVPRNRKIYIHMTSKDVIHSLYLPNVRTKLDALPGRVTRLWFEVTKEGKYDVACAEMCGISHYLMKASMFVKSPEKFEEWLNQANEIALVANETENPDVYWGWKWGSEK